MEVVLTNMCDTIFHSGRFLLPSKEPVKDLSSYRAIYSESTGCYVVVTRETGQHNYKAMTIPYIRWLPDVQQEVSLADASENCDASTANSIPAVIPEEELREEIPQAALTQVKTPPLVPEYYSSPTGDDWANLDEEEQCSEFNDLADSISHEIGPSETRSTSVCFEGVDLGDAELKNVRHGKLSRDIIALDIGLSVECATQAWSKGTCVQSLDLRIRDANKLTLSEWILDGVRPSSQRIDLNERPGSTGSSESCVTDHDQASTGFPIQMREEVNVQCKLPNLRQHIAKDTSQDVQLVLQHSAGLFKTESQTHQYAHGVVDWFYMMQASRRLLASGKSQRRPLFEETGRSVGKTARPTTVDSAPAGTGTCRVHHYNFNAMPVYRKSSTPPAVSYWVTTSPALKEWNDYTGSLHQIVVSSQAAKYVDPYLYHGPQISGIIEGTALQEHVTGHVEKVYSSYGNWSEDNLDVDDDRPADGGETPVCLSSRCAGLNLLPRPYEVSVADGNPLVNDDGRRHPPALSKDRQVVGRPSWLSFTENAYDVEDELNSETPPVIVPDTVSMGEEVCPGVVREQDVSHEENVTEPPEADNAVQSAAADSCPRMAAWLAKIYHLSSLPIEEKVAYLNEAWSPPSKTHSQDRQDLSRWCEQSKSLTSRNQDLARWSEEAENVNNQQRNSDVYLPSETEDQGESCVEINEPVGNRVSATPGVFAGKSVAGLSTDEFGLRHQLETTVHIIDYVDTVDINKTCGDSQRCMRTETAQTEISFDENSGLSFESGKNITFKILRDSTDIQGAKMETNDPPVDLEPAQPYAAPKAVTTSSPMTDFDGAAATEAAPDTLGISKHLITINSIDDSNFSVGREAGDDCIAVQEIDKCLDDIKELMSPLHFDTTRCSPFQRPNVALGCYSELSINDEWSSEQELNKSSLKLSDIIYDEWSNSSEDESSRTKEKQEQADDSSASSDAISVGGGSPQPVQEVLDFSQIYVIYDAPVTTETDCAGSKSIVEDIEEAASSEVEPDDQEWEDVKVDGEFLRTFIRGEYVQQTDERTSNESLLTEEEKDADISIKRVVSRSLVTQCPEVPKGRDQRLENGPQTSSEAKVQANSTNVEAEVPRYLHTATQTEDQVYVSEAEPPAVSSSTHFDCSGLFNISLPKISLTDCLVYGGAALYLGHQAYRAFRR